MQRLLFVNRYFYPDHSATSQILSDLAMHLAAIGHEVHVVTSRQIYDDPHAALSPEETVKNLRVHRVASTRFGRSSMIGRAADYVSFYRSVSDRLTRLARSGDLIIAMTDPPLVSLVAAAAARRTGAALINWLQDLYPEVAVELEVPLLRGPVAAAVTALRDRSLRSAATNVAVGELMEQRLRTRGVPPEQVDVVPNWCDDEDIRPLATAQNPLRRQWGLDGKFIVGYSGNLGRAHEFDTVLGAAECVRDDARMIFMMIGGGSRFGELKQAVRARRLDHLFRFLPYQDRNILPHSLALPDVHWLSLRPRLEGLLVPSKFYGIAAAGKPIIVIGAVDGELAKLVRRYDCGAVIVPGDVAALVATLSRFADAPDAVAATGARARRMLEAHFRRQQGLRRWGALLQRLDRSVHPWPHASD
jgi:colanic acid biosynthesis glycosyl transferase WcaI